VAFSFRGRFRPWSPEAIWFLIKVACVNLPGFVAVLSGLEGGLLAFLFQGIVEAILFCAGVIESEDNDIDNVYDLVLFACSKRGLVDYMFPRKRKPTDEPAAAGQDDMNEEIDAEANGPKPSEPGKSGTGAEKPETQENEKVAVYVPEYASHQQEGKA